MPWEYVKPTTQTQRDRIERALYPDEPDKVESLIPEGVELDIAEEDLRENETHAAWAKRQVRKLRMDNK